MPLADPDATVRFKCVKGKLLRIRIVATEEARFTFGSRPGAAHMMNTRSGAGLPLEGILAEQDSAGFQTVSAKGCLALDHAQELR